MPLLLAALVFASVFFGLARWTRATATNAVDSELAARLRQSVPLLTTSINRARTKALVIATDPTVQRLLATRNAAGLTLHAGSNVRFEVAGRTIAGQIDQREGPVKVAIVSRGRVVGSVVVGALLPRPAYPLIIGLGGRVIAGPGAGSRLSLVAGRPAYVDLGGARYRALGLTLAESGRHWFVAAAESASQVADRIASTRERAAGAVAAALVAVAAALLFLRDTRRRRAEARAAAESAAALGMVGDALAATHEPQILLPVILRAFVEASRASGGRLLDFGAEIARTGQLPDDETRHLTIDLGSYGNESHPVVELYGLEELDSVANSLVRSLTAQSRTALENAYLHHVVEQQASTDELTQLANRRRFMEGLRRERRRTERFGGAVAVVLADLDDFKLVNDRFGHQTGDEVLVEFANVVRSELREVDLAARLGGEEFAILLPETDLDGAVALAERIRAKLSDRQLGAGAAHGIRVTASFGVAAHPASGMDADLLLISDVALYRAKKLGKNRVVSMTPPQ